MASHLVRDLGSSRTSTDGPCSESYSPSPARHRVLMRPGSGSGSVAPAHRTVRDDSLTNITWAPTGDRMPGTRARHLVELARQPPLGQHGSPAHATRRRWRRSAFGLPTRSAGNGAARQGPPRAPSARAPGGALGQCSASSGRSRRRWRSSPQGQARPPSPPPRQPAPAGRAAAAPRRFRTLDSSDMTPSRHHRRGARLEQPATRLRINRRTYAH